MHSNIEVARPKILKMNIFLFPFWMLHAYCFPVDTKKYQTRIYTFWHALIFVTCL